MSQLPEQLEALVERLRAVVPYQGKSAVAFLCHEAADALTELIRERDAMREALEEIRDLPGEINPSNYDHDDVCELNRQFCYSFSIADNALKGTQP